MPESSSFPSSGRQFRVVAHPLLDESLQILKRKKTFLPRARLADGEVGPKWVSENGEVGVVFNPEVDEVLLKKISSMVFEDIKHDPAPKKEITFFGSVLKDLSSGKKMAETIAKIDAIITEEVVDNILKQKDLISKGGVKIEGSYEGLISRMSIQDSPPRKSVKGEPVAETLGYLISSEEYFSRKQIKTEALDRAQKIVRQVLGKTRSGDRLEEALEECVDSLSDAVAGGALDPLLDFIVDAGSGRLRSALTTAFAGRLVEVMGRDKAFLKNSYGVAAHAYLSRAVSVVKALQEDSKDKYSSKFKIIPEMYDDCGCRASAFSLSSFSNHISFLYTLPTWFSANEIISDGIEGEAGDESGSSFRVVNYSIKLGSVAPSTKAGSNLRYALDERVSAMADQLEKIGKISTERKIQELFSKIVFLAMVLPGVRFGSANAEVPNGTPEEIFQFLSQFKISEILGSIVAHGVAEACGKKRAFGKQMTLLITGISESVKKHVPAMMSEVGGDAPVTIFAAVDQRLFDHQRVTSGASTSILRTTSNSEFYEYIKFSSEKDPVTKETNSGAWFVAKIGCKFRWHYVCEHLKTPQKIPLTRCTRTGGKAIILSLFDYSPSRGQVAQNRAFKNTYDAVTAGTEGCPAVRCFLSIPRVERKNRGVEREQNLMACVAGLAQAVIVWRLAKLLSVALGIESVLLLRFDTSDGQILYPLVHAIEILLGEFVSVHHQGIKVELDPRTQQVNDKVHRYKIDKVKAAQSLVFPLVLNKSDIASNFTKPVCILASCSDPTITTEYQDGSVSAASKPLLRTMAYVFVPFNGTVRCLRSRLFARVGPDIRQQNSIAIHSEGVIEAIRWINERYGVETFIWIQRLFRQFKAKRIALGEYNDAVCSAYGQIVKSVKSTITVIPVSMSKHKAVKDIGRVEGKLYYADDLDSLRGIRPSSSVGSSMIPFLGVSTFRIVETNEAHLRQHSGINAYSFLQVSRDYPDQIERARSVALEEGLNHVRSALVLAHFYECQSIKLGANRKIDRDKFGAAVLDPFSWMDPVSYGERGSFIIQEGDSVRQSATPKSVMSFSGFLLAISDVMLSTGEDSEDAQGEG